MDNKTIIQLIRSLSAIILDGYPNANQKVYKDAFLRLKDLLYDIEKDQKCILGKEDADIIGYFLDELDLIRKGQSEPDDSLEWLYCMVASIRDYLTKKQ
jgi:hypothetical protein